MPPETRVMPRFAAEPPQEPLPYGRWADRLRGEFLSAALEATRGEDDLGEPGEAVFFPDRSWHGRTYVPVSMPTASGAELFGYVSWTPPAREGEEPSEFAAWADWTEETAARHPDWRIDLSDAVVGHWRGEGGHQATMTLVWGVALVPGATTATAELAALVVDQCPVSQDRFTLLAPDAYRADELEVTLWDRRGRELARESLYAEEDEEEG